MSTTANPAQTPVPTPNSVPAPPSLPATTAQDTAQQQVVVQQTASSPIECVLSRLTNVQEASEPRQWSAQCPAHSDEHASLSVSEGDDGKVLLTCHAGCDLEGIVSALDLKVSDLFPSPGLTLTQYAEAKKLALDLLMRWGLSNSQFSGRPTLKIPYVDADMKAVAVRFRLSLNGPERFRWRKDAELCPYGLWMLPDAVKAGYVVLVEGESDCHTLWYHGIPALGVPGAKTWRDEWAEFLKEVPTVYVVVEPDKGGETLRKKLLQSSALQNRLRFIRLNGAKDPSELHVNDPQGFASAWLAALACATSPQTGRTKVKSVTVPITLDQLMQVNYPAPTPLVDKILFSGEVALFAARQKIGKSIFSLQLSIDVAHGDPFLGKFPTTQTTVLYVDYENRPHHLQDRARDLLNGRPAPTNLYLKSFARASDRDVGLADKGDFERLAELVRQLKPGLLIIDPLRYAILGADTQKEKDALEAIDAVMKLQNEHFDMAIILVHHLRKQQGSESLMPVKLREKPEEWIEKAFGSQALIGHAETIWGLELDSSDDNYTFATVPRSQDALVLLLEKQPNSERFILCPMQAQLSSLSSVQLNLWTTLPNSFTWTQALQVARQLQTSNGTLNHVVRKTRAAGLLTQNSATRVYSKVGTAPAPTVGPAVAPGSAAPPQQASQATSAIPMGTPAPPVSRTVQFTSPTPGKSLYGPLNGPPVPGLQGFTKRKK